MSEAIKCDMCGQFAERPSQLYEVFVNGRRVTFELEITLAPSYVGRFCNSDLCSACSLQAFAALVTLRRTELERLNKE